MSLGSWAKTGAVTPGSVLWWLLLLLIARVVGIFFAIPVQGTIKRLSSLYMRSTICVDFFQWKGLDEMHVGSDKVRPKTRLQQVCAIIFT